MTKPPAIGRPSQFDRILAKERHEPEYASPAPTFWGETKEKRSFEDRHESTKTYLALRDARAA